MSKNGGKNLWNVNEETKCNGRKEYEQRKKTCINP